MKNDKAVFRRLPVGAEVQPRVESISASGRRVANEWRSCWSRLSARVPQLLTNSNRTVPDIFPACYSMQRRECSIDFASMTKKAYPDPASRFQPDGPHGPSQVVDPAAFRLDRRRLARASRIARPGHLRDARRHVHARRDLAGGRARAADPGRARHHRARVMPVADFPARSAGATTAWTCSRRRASTARRTTFAASSIARTHGTRRDPRRGLQPLRARTATTSGVLATTTSPIATRTNGASALNFDGHERRAGARVLHRQCRLLDRRVPPRRPAAGRHAADLRRLAAARAGGDHAARVREAARGRAHAHRRRERAAGRAARPAARAGRLRHGCAVERRLPPHRHGRR